MGYTGGGANGRLRWRGLALDILLPVDKEKESRACAENGQRRAGTMVNQYQPPSQQLEAAGEEGDADDENETDKNDGAKMLEEREDETSFEDEDEWVN